MLAGKKILIAVTGSIAAYKIPHLVRLLIKSGAEVKVIMTPAAEDFVSRLTLATLSRNTVDTNLFEEETWANHVMLGRWADLMLVAPLSCNTLSKMANGACDNLVLATYLSAICPVIVAPAMDEDMWHHPSTKANIQKLEQYGCIIAPVEYGELASGLVGEGRMAEPETLLRFLEGHFTRKDQLKDKKVLVTAGPTYEAIDPVRFIGNHSSGKMGFALAEEFGKRGAKVILVTGPVSLKAPAGNVSVIRVRSAEEMLEACNGNQDFDIGVMAAAVADYTPTVVFDKKIKKEDSELRIDLKRTKDILETLGKEKQKGQLLVGFALEIENEAAYARNKLERKNADLIVMNSLRDEGAGFGHDTNKVTLFYKDGSEKELPLKDKKLLAADLVDAITELIK